MAITSGSYYRDWRCTQIATPISTGRAAIIGSAAEKSRWGEYNYQSPLGYIYSAFGRDLGTDKITFSGGSVIWDNRLEQTRPTGSNIEKDQIRNDIIDYIYNPLFIGHDEDFGYCLAINSNDVGTEYDIQLCRYTQQPKEGNRETWQYQIESQGYFWNPRWATSAENFGLDTYPLIKQFRVTIWNTDFFLIAVGVDDSGDYYRGDLTHRGALFILIPAEYYSEKLETPYVGPVSKESVEASFMPMEERHDEILSRTNYDENPYGVNSGSGIKLIFPNVLQDQSVYSGNMQQIINGIYRGSATGFINMATQYIAEQVGGNSARAASEVSVILNGILSAHSLPLIYPAGSSTTYATNATQFQTICGYDVLLNQIDVTSPGQKTIFEYTYTPPRIEPCLNCFLDFEPYTQITLKLPFFPSMSLPPSLIYGNNLKVTYKIDVLTGILSADVAVIYFGREFIISTVQQNVKTSIPIMGAGGQDGALQKISSSAISLISSFGASSYQSGDEMQTGTSFNAGAAAGAILTGADAISKAGTAVPVGKMSVDGLGVYLSPRSAYLIITHPEAAIPAREEDGVITGSFLDTFGMAANLGGIVSDFAGGFASFSSVDLSGFDATEEEKAAIRSALLEGVYV